jgi:hypothetical protein
MSKIFSNASDLINYATQIIKVERLPSLKRDVKICVCTSCAFPAILYCFSTIDLLGALYKGRISDTTENSRQYMEKFMKNNSVPYSAYQVELLQKIYRHKVVHLAQPKPVVEINSENITWRYYEEDLSNHLKIETTPTPQPITAFTLPYPMNFNKIFVISILKLARDIEDSVLRPFDGYWDMLVNNTVGDDGRPLQDCFDDAIRKIYDPKLKFC